MEQVEFEREVAAPSSLLLKINIPVDENCGIL